MTRSKFKQSIKQGMAIITIAVILALATNAARDDGVALSHDFFPATVVAPPETNGNQDNESQGQDQGPEVISGVPDENTEPADGIQRAGIEEVEIYFEESLNDSSMIFVDARRRSDYEEGHIPGAVWLYHYQSERLFPDVRDDLEQAFIIIVYCNGGDCEDSIHLASDLSSHYGIPSENIFVFEGGMSEWKEAGFPVQVGEER